MNKKLSAIRNLRKRLVRKCDDLFSKIVKARDGYCCQHCGSDTKQMQCAHFYSRSIKSVRWEPLNAVCLCAGCHLNFAHKEPHEFSQWFADRLGKFQFDALRAKKLTKAKTDTATLKLRLMWLRKEAQKYGVSR